MKTSLLTIIYILIQCKLMLGYSIFSVIEGIIFQKFLRKNLKNPFEIQNKSSFVDKTSQSAPDVPNDSIVEINSTSSGRRSKQVFLSGCHF